MQLLTTTKVYDVGEDRSLGDFIELVRNPPVGIVILDGNAGLGADWPAGIWKSLEGAALAFAIISAPSTIEENWPKWKAIFNYVAQHILEFYGECRIDRDTAQVIAIHHAVTNCGFRSKSLNVHMAIRHYFSTFASYEDLLKSERVDMDWDRSDLSESEAFSHGVQSNEEAAKQARCRYVFGIEDYKNCLTLVVEQDGSVLIAKNFNMSHEWA